jgi:antitoxin (DNA-binding transcriptional repressor) of toxin-antitoxin stability system
MKLEISSTDAVRNFGHCLAQVKYRGDSFLITKNKERVAELSPLIQERSGTIKDFLGLWIKDPEDISFADDLEKANSKEMPESNPWD